MIRSQSFTPYRQMARSFVQVFVLCDSCYKAFQVTSDLLEHSPTVTRVEVFASEKLGSNSVFVKKQK